VLESLQRAASADVVLLPRREIFLDEIPVGYGGDEDTDRQYCPKSPSDQRPNCLLRVSLDRVMWKGDYMERVAVQGSDLKKILDASAKKESGKDELRTTDLFQQWLVTYGVTQQQPSNLTKLSN